ncbi:MAG: DUF4384 domain-containing protein, partial [Isosphaeraceae bacterium]
PKFYVRVSVDRQYRIYGEGETLTLKVRCEEDAYLYVLYQQADGKIFQIFPNSGQPDNRIKARQDIQVPAADDAFRWVIGPPFGHEVVKVIASKKPVDALSLPRLKDDHFNPVTQEHVDGAGKQLAKELPNVWSEHDLAIQTVRKGEPTTPPEAHKRFGVFFGVSKYEFNDVKERISEGKAKWNLNFAHKDAVDMKQALEEVGRLAGLRLYQNEEATRKQMKSAITEWLPSVSRPGDTVFIFFSGHGTQIPDDGSEEKDGKDEVLMTTDALDFRVFNEMFKLDKDGKLPPGWARCYNEQKPGALDVWRRTYQESGGAGAEPESIMKACEQTEGFLLRATAVDDDEMGHWVQKLDGRRVVVIVDACMSGGLTPSGGTPDKGLKGGGRPRAAEFDFLTSGFARLKDLDQPSLSVLTACGEEEMSVESSKLENGLFTSALKVLLKESPGPVDLRQAKDYCKARITETLDRINDDRRREKKELFPPFEPHLFTTDARPVYLKPAP